MPSFTPNRGYPYSVNSDPADIPQAIQDLAEAVDLDMQNLDTAIVQKPVSLVSSISTDPQVFPADVTTPCTFDFLEFDNSGTADLVTRPDRLRPTTAGLWVVWGSLVLPNFFFTSKNLHILVNGVSVYRASFYFQIEGRLTTMSLAGMSFMNGTSDYFQLGFNPAGATDNVQVTTKRMGCFRLTNT